ncbi:ArsR/SmtB family transcription factor [Paenibacillus sp. HJGM_3]|uniref:ArsR/SmtB family transcription factor n=1 Tax=Paenibacillus sp. HJGM_3 TaxID=3379816 RepID=UPI0038596B4A
MKSTLYALAEPNRFQIVELLRKGPLTVGEITDRLGLIQPKVSKHLRILSDTGLVEVRVKGNRRVYKLRPDPFRELESWIESYRLIIDESFDRMDDYLQAIKEEEKSHDKH